MIYEKIEELTAHYLASTENLGSILEEIESILENYLAENPFTGVV